MREPLEHFVEAAHGRSPALWLVVVLSVIMLRDCQTGGEIERLDAGAYRGSLRCLRHSISADGPKIPYTKAVKSRSLSPADKRHQIGLVDAQAIFCRRRHQPRRPPLQGRVQGPVFLLGFVFVMTLHARCVVTSSGPLWRHPAAGRWMIRCN